MKVLWLDTETTGSDPKIHEIVQIAALAEIDGIVREEINLFLRPSGDHPVESAAMAVQGTTMAQLRAYPARGIAFTQFVAFLDRHVNKFDKRDKFYPAGHNVSFDLDFVQEWFKRSGEMYGTGSYQNWRALDTRALANWACRLGVLSVPDVKLGTLCAYYGITLHAHDALNDIRATRQLSHELLNVLRVTQRSRPV